MAHFISKLEIIYLVTNEAPSGLRGCEDVKTVQRTSYGYPELAEAPLAYDYCQCSVNILCMICYAATRLGLNQPMALFKPARLNGGHLLDTGKSAM